ncbi:MAG: glycosyltransferase [Synergistes sp.]|nr:glycosyltransferase [Synergistes sp.]
MENKEYNILILLAAHKGNRFIREQLDSILNQDYHDWHLVVSDDGTETQEILQEYADKHPDKITHYKSGRTFGTAQGHFMHLLKTFHNAKYIMFSDQDDVWHTDKVRITLDKMHESEAKYGGDLPLLVFTDLRWVNNTLGVIAESYDRYNNRRYINGQIDEERRCSFNWMFLFCQSAGCTIMMNKALGEFVALKDFNCKHYAHDHYVALWASLLGRCEYLDVPTIDYRLHNNNVCARKRETAIEWLRKRAHMIFVKVADDTFQYQNVQDIVSRISMVILKTKIYSF